MARFFIALLWAGVFFQCINAEENSQSISSPPPEYSYKINGKKNEFNNQKKTKFFKPDIKINDYRYNWLLKPYKPAATASQNNNTVKAVIQGYVTQINNRFNYSTAPMTRELNELADFLDIRCFLREYQTDDSPKFEEITDAVIRAKQAGVKKVELSVILSNDMDQTYSKTAARMQDYQGKYPSENKGDYHPESNNTFFSYWDPENIASMQKLIERTIKYCKNHAETDKEIFEWHFRYPGHNDWWYPLSNSFYDYSEPTQKAFRQYLQNEKKLSLTDINSRYSLSLSSFDQLKLPAPEFSKTNLSTLWQDFQNFRVYTIYKTQQNLYNTVRTYDKDRKMLCWMTTALRTAGRDGIIIDKSLQLTKNNPDSLSTITCFDHWKLESALYGSLAELQGIPLGIEPVHNTMDSYIKTFYNALKYPVRQINWLFWLEMDPMERPWIIWALRRGELLNTFATARLKHANVACLLSYSDIQNNITPKLWERTESYSNKEKLYKQFELSNITMNWISDYSDKLNLNEIKTIICPDNQTLQDAMAKRLIEFVYNGGKLVVSGTDPVVTNKNNMNITLLNMFGINISGSSEFKQGCYRYGKGTIYINTSNIKDLYLSALKDTGISEKGKQLLKWCGAEISIETDKIGATSFVKEHNEGFYLTYINTTDGELNISSKLKFVDDGKKYVLRDLLSDNQDLVVSGKELKDKGIAVNFSFQWEIFAFAIQPVK